MSIAIAALIRPSRSFALLSVAMGGVLLAAALVLAQERQSTLHHGLAIACALASACISLFPLSRRKHLRIDVSGIGQIRLVDTSPDAVAGSSLASTCDGEVVQLLRGSTFWSSLLVLRLQTQSGRAMTLLIFADSVGSATFHALSVACLWVASRHSSPVAQPADFSLPAD